MEHMNGRDRLIEIKDEEFDGFFFTNPKIIPAQNGRSLLHSKRVFGVAAVVLLSIVFGKLAFYF